MSAPESTSFTSTQDEIQYLLARLGALTSGAPASGNPSANLCPTLRDYYGKVCEAITSNAAKTYDTYWQQLVRALGDRRLNEVRTSDLQVVANAAKRNALVRRNSGGGEGAQENCVGAMRAFFALAVGDHHMKENPAAAVKKPGRRRNNRRALTEPQLLDLYRITAAGGNDPHLDLLLVRFHLETGARRGGALALTLADLDQVNQCVQLHEKGGTSVWQPVSRTLLDALTAHARIRGAVAAQDQVLRYLPTRTSPVGTPLTRRRYNTLADRWQASMTDPSLRGLSIHWLRHTAITNVERLAGFAVARAFARHEDGAETTTTYIKGNLSEVARAVALMTNEAHPLAPSEKP